MNIQNGICLPSCPLINSSPGAEDITSSHKIPAAQQRVYYARTHHREKPDLPQNRVWNHLFPHSVLEGRSKKAGLGSSSKPKNCLQILKQKRGSQPFGHIKWPGVGPNELICGSGGPLKAAFWPITFPRVRLHCPTFLPLHFFC